ncbi:MAG: hypothetical protein Q4D45_00805 [Lachnospiraceae bacterium]|nr:hypothetical protein [Lachnospiraceae bacterium]
MGDVVLEWDMPYIISRKRLLIKAIGISAAVVLVLDSLLIPALWFLVVPMLIAEFIIFRNWKYEYEFEYVNGDLEISKIIRKCKRKVLFQGHRKDVEYLTEGRQDEPGISKLDCTSGIPNTKVYTMKIDSKLIYFEPNDDFIREMDNYHKVRR